MIVSALANPTPSFAAQQAEPRTSNPAGLPAAGLLAAGSSVSSRQNQPAGTASTFTTDAWFAALESQPSSAGDGELAPLPEFDFLASGLAALWEAGSEF